METTTEPTNEIQAQKERIEILETQVAHLKKVLIELTDCLEGLSLEPHVYTNEPMLMFEDSHTVHGVRVLLSEIQ